MAGFFFTNCLRSAIEKSCKYMRNNSTRQKDFNFTLKFRAQRNGMEMCDQKRLESLEEEKGGAHFMQAWYQKNLQTLYQSTNCRQTHVT